VHTRLRTSLRIAAWTTSGLLGLGIAAGAADAVVSHASSNPATASSAVSGLSAAANGKAGARAGGRRGLLRRAVHGQVTLRAKGGFVDAAIQRGTVQNISGSSIEVKSADGFDQTYVINAQTKLRSRGKTITTSAIPGQAQVLVIATKQGNDWVARRVALLVGKAAKGGATPPSATQSSDT
jgi:hypothetical protein